MTKIDIISGFLGAGKTTFIKKLLKEAIAGEKVVLIENEFGEIGIDGGFLKDSGIEIREMNSGCICCSLVGDFGRSLNEVLTKYTPDRVIIEPSGVGKLSDVMKAVCDVAGEIDVVLNGSVTVVDAQKCKMYMKNFGEFFNNQIESAGTIVLSRTDVADADKVAQCVEMIREKNPKAAIVTTPIDKLTGEQLLEIIEQPTDDMAEKLLEEVKEGHHHHHDDDDEECCCGHHHHHHDDDDDDEDEHEHHHHHHDDDEECECGHHHHHHDDDDDDEDEHEHHHHHHGDDEECGCGHHHHHDDDDDEHEHHHHHDGECGCGHHHHHHDHDADEVFTSWGLETNRTITKEKLESLLQELAHSEKYGQVLRAKGMLPDADGTWYYFDLVPEETEIRTGAPIYTGKVCVIGSNLKEDELKAAFEA
ncbi:cobalamin biosynthesis protein CobW [Clostridium sp. AM34-11AC]|jgi:G3E family GTPase|uniref:CobW family GTP-binding protein n=1 Tax=Clostridium sp. AM34-11AC TaxID=2305242 RepID=UPI000E406576|nr:CobW family GTP-binding protein [Clostridium sp. AM34-11AC]RGE06587.1 cobalamin biosynthesis protein CobW [Clostridium sp. AM34-11AC]